MTTTSPSPKTTVACIAIWPSCAPATAPVSATFSARWGSITAIWTPVTMCWPWSTRCRSCAISIIPSCCTSPPQRARALSQPRATPSAGIMWVRLTWRLGASSARAIRASLRRAPMPILRARRSAPPSSAIRRSWASRRPRPTSWALHPSFAPRQASSLSTWALPRNTP